MRTPASEIGGTGGVSASPTPASPGAWVGVPLDGGMGLGCDGAFGAGDGRPGVGGTPGCGKLGAGDGALGDGVGGFGAGAPGVGGAPVGPGGATGCDASSTVGAPGPPRLVGSGRGVAGASPRWLQARTMALAIRPHSETGTIRRIKRVMTVFLCGGAMRRVCRCRCAGGGDTVCLGARLGPHRRPPSRDSRGLKPACSASAGGFRGHGNACRRSGAGCAPGLMNVNSPM
jgi:hypothetical protein